MNALVFVSGQTPDGWEKGRRLCLPRLPAWRAAKVDL